MPDGAARTVLRSEIARLAAANGTVPFEPHVTLLPGLDRPEEEVLPVGIRLGREIPPLALSVRGIGHSAEFFRCVFLELEPSAELVRAWEKARELAATSRLEAFRPHVSLVYGELDVGTRRALIGALDPLFPRTFSSSTLELVRTEGSPEAWRTVAAFPLSAPPPRLRGWRFTPVGRRDKIGRGT